MNKLTTTSTEWKRTPTAGVFHRNYDAKMVGVITPGTEPGIWLWLLVDIRDGSRKVIKQDNGLSIKTVQDECDKYYRMWCGTV